MGSSDSHPLELEASISAPTDALGKTSQLRINVGPSANQSASPVATGARIAIRFSNSVRVGLAFRTKPKRAMLGKLTGDSGGETDLELGNIDTDEVYGFLLNLQLPSPSIEPVAYVTLSYDDPSTQTRGRQIELTVLAEQPAPAEVKDESDQATKGSAVDEPSDTHTPDPLQAAIDELADATPQQAASVLLEAHRSGDRPRTLAAMQQLLRRSDQLEDEIERSELEEMLERIESGGSLSKKMLDDCFRASRIGVSEEAAKIYDVVLTGAGDSPILVVREIRAATALELRDVNDLVGDKELAIGHALPFAQAGALKRRIEAVGGHAEVRPSSGKPQEEPQSDAAAEEEERRKKKRKRRRQRR